MNYSCWANVNAFMHTDSLRNTINGSTTTCTKRPTTMHWSTLLMISSLGYNNLGYLGRSNSTGSKHILRVLGKTWPRAESHCVELHRMYRGTIDLLLCSHTLRLSESHFRCKCNITIRIKDLVL